MNKQSVSPNAVVSRQSLPYAEPVLKPNVAAQKARAQASAAQYYKTNIFQRILVQMSDWVNSRVSTFRIASALEPFVRQAGGKVTGPVSENHVAGLNSALASAQSVKNGSETVVNAAVSQALSKLDLREKAALREQLLSEKGLSERVRDGLLYAVTASLQESISADADFYVLSALKCIAKMAESPLEGECPITMVHPFLHAHSQLVSPGAESAYKADGVLSPERQIAYLSLTTTSKVQSWFNAKPPQLQKKITAGIKQIVDDKTLQTANAPDRTKRTRAFYIWLQQALASNKAS